MTVDVDIDPAIDFIESNEIGPRLWIVLHHTGAWEKDTEQVKRAHLARGFRDIGYNYVIEYDGKIVAGRSLNIPGAHTKGEMNYIGIGVALLGNFEEKPPTQQQIESLVDLIVKLIKDNNHEINLERISQHLDHLSTLCAGKHFPYEAVKTMVIAKLTPSDYSGHWAEKEILEVIDIGLMKGYPDGTFQPDKLASRAEQAVGLLNLYKKIKEVLQCKCQTN